MTYIHIKYTTTDGQEHEQTVPIAEHPIVGITSDCIIWNRHAVYPYLWNIMAWECRGVVRLSHRQ